MKHCKFYITALVALLMTAFNAVAMAAVQPIWLEINKAQQYRTGSSPITRVAVASPAIADVVVIDNTELQIIGKATGSTSMTVWNANGMRQEFVITVSNMDTATAQHIKHMMGLDNVDVSKVGEKIILQGKVKNQNELQKALGIAQLYVGSAENVINLIEMKQPTMVNLSAMVIDINDTDARNLGIQYGNAADSGSSGGGGSTSITFGAPGDFYGGKNYYNSIGHPFNNIDFMIQALAKKNKVKILSRPNITTLSGEEAEILVGGEMGVPVTKDGEISIEWKEYGIHLKIKPTVDSENKIMTKVYAEVSDINLESGLKTTAGMVYGLTSRKANTTVSLVDGSTMAIGGLMNSNQSKVVSKIPILGDIPIIGNFFRHTAKSKEKRELMILIKPTIVTPSTPIKGSEKMDEAIEENKRDLAGMQEIRPDDTPKPELTSAEKKQAKKVAKAK